MMDKRTHLFDVDGVIVPDRWFIAINDYLDSIGKPTYNSRDEFKTFYLGSEAFPDEKERNAFFDHFAKYNFYDGLKPIDGAVDGLRELSERDNVYLATSCYVMEGRRDFLNEYEQKVGWVMDNLPFIPSKNVIAISPKHLLRGDSITDDSMKNLNGDIQTKLLFTDWHNKGISKAELDAGGIVRANHWGDVMEQLK